MMHFKLIQYNTYAFVVHVPRVLVRVRSNFQDALESQESIRPMIRPPSEAIPLPTARW